MRALASVQADAATCDLAKTNSLVMPKVPRVSDPEKVGPQSYYVADKTGSLPSGPPTVPPAQPVQPGEPKKEAEPAKPAPPQPQGAKQDLPPAMQSRVNIILLNFRISRNEVIAKYMPQIQEVCAEAVLGPGVLPKFAADVKANEDAVDAALAKANLPQFKQIEELCEDMRAVLRANKGLPENNPAVTKMFQERIDKIMAGMPKDPKNPNPYEMPAEGFTNKYIDALQRTLKTDLCVEKWKGFDASKFATLVPGGPVSALYGAAFGPTLDEKIEKLYPGYAALTKVVETSVELTKAEKAYDAKRELVFAKQKELGRAWMTPTDPRYLPKFVELGNEYKKAMVAILDKRDKELKELGLMLEPPPKK